MSLSFARSILVFLSESALVASHSGQVSWSGPAQCIDEASLFAKVAEAKSKEAVSPLHHVRGTAEQTPSGYRFVLELLEGASLRGQRVMEMEGGDCRKEDDALALIIAMLLEGSVAVEPAVTSGPPKPKPQKSVPEEPSGPKVKVEEDSSRGIRFGWGLSVSSNLGLLPQISPGIGGMVKATWDKAFSAKFSTSYLVPSRTGGNTTVELGALSGGMAACREWSIARADFGLCAGFSVIALHARGQGFEDNRAGWSILPASEVSLPLGWRLAALRLEISPGMTFPWKRVQYKALGVPLHRTDPVMGTLALSSTWEF